MKEHPKANLKDFTNFMFGRDLKLFESCLPPCIKMSIGIKQTSYYTTDRRNAKISFVTKEEVIVNKDTYSYDVFNLVVDIGRKMWEL